MGYYVMGRYTSVAWTLKKRDAERIARTLNHRGGSHYRVVPVPGRESK